MSNTKTTKPLRVMLVDDKSDRREMLDLALRDVDCVLVACVSGDGDLLAAVERCNPDVILIDIEAPGRDTLESLETVQSTVPRPMVMFSQDDNNQTIRRATRAGVSAYVVDGLQTQRVRPIIDAAVARFQHFNFLESELRKAHQQLNGCVRCAHGFYIPLSLALSRKGRGDASICNGCNRIACLYDLSGSYPCSRIERPLSHIGRGPGGEGG